MAEVRHLHTNGNPVAAVREFLKSLWASLDLDAFLLPLHDDQTGHWETHLTDSSNDLSKANPFIPVMIENIASQIKTYSQTYPEKNLAVFLRPCELEAWQTIRSNQEQGGLEPFTVSIDCLGTYPPGDYEWRSDRKGSEDILFSEYLRFSRLGGISPYRLRIACQLCKNPISRNADVNIHYLGIPVDEILLFTLSDRIEGALRDLDKLPKPTNELLSIHKAASEKLINRNQKTRERLAREITDDIDLALDSIVENITSCEDCQSCLLSCPICANHGIIPGSTLTRRVIADWMISCAGCGMCEGHCETHAPFVRVFAVLREKLAKI